MLKLAGKKICFLVLTIFAVLFLTVHSYAETTSKALQSPGGGAGGAEGSGTVMPDLFTGSMHYSIPIDVPPGRKGMQPNLSLTYRSANTDGWVGVGWDIEIPTIERSTRNGLVYTGDGNGYVLRMGGAAIDLIKVQGKDNEYQAKIEGSFFKIIKTANIDGSPKFWDIYDKGGLHYIFGQNVYGADEPKQYDSSDPSKVFKWYLDRVEDRNGNYMQYSYWKNQNQIFIDKINYTGNTGLSSANYIKFYWESRTDAPDGGVLILVLKMLSKILLFDFPRLEVVSY